MQTRPKKILIIRPGAIGDVVHTTVIAKAIKESHSDWVVDYLTQVEIAPILKDNPCIDNIYVIDRKYRKSMRYIFNIGRELFKQRYDIIFCLTNSVRNFVWAALACPKRIILRKHCEGSWVENFFYTAQSIIPDITLPDRLYLGVSKKNLDNIKDELSKYSKPYFMIIPGGDTDRNRQGRIWNINNWQELSVRLLKKYGGTVVVCGSKGERKYHECLEGDKVLVTSGEYSLAQTSALLSQADIVVSGDTGTLHIASAHNVKTLSLLGSTSPDKVKPYGINGHYISADSGCKYCWQKACKYLKSGKKYTPCMENITVSMVMDKIHEILDSASFSDS